MESKTGLEKAQGRLISCHFASRGNNEMEGFCTIEKDGGGGRAALAQRRGSTDLPNSRVKDQGAEKVVKACMCYAAKGRAATNGVGGCLVDICVRSNVSFTPGKGIDIFSCYRRRHSSGVKRAARNRDVTAA